MCQYLKVPYISLFTNGTLPLICSLQALRITGEVITTPYSFVATTHALWWNGIKPVFVDIDPKTCNIDPNKIEAAITPKNTIEGGALVCHDRQIKERVDFLKNFGFAGETQIVAPGINGKIDEIRSAYGLLNLKAVDSAIEYRHQISKRYREGLGGIDGISYMPEMHNIRHNYSYFPIFIDSVKYGITRDELYEKMKRNGVCGRRYFYPLITNFSTYCGLDSAQISNLPVANRIANSVICLPLHTGLTSIDVERIIELLKK